MQIYTNYSFRNSTQQETSMVAKAFHAKQDVS